MKTAQTYCHNPERGFALVGTLLLLLLLMSLGSAAAFYSKLDLKSTSHFNTGNQALLAAESGILRGVNAMNVSGVVDFDADVVQKWSTVYGATTQTIPGYGQFSYQVAVAPDPADPIQRGLITSTGLAPNNAQRVVRARVRRGPVGEGRGAIYLAADSVASQFTGNSFDVDGNDHDQFGALVPGGRVEPGIATRNDTVTNGVKSSLNTQQKDNVRGLGFTFNPLNPSVVTTNGPSVSDVDDIIAKILTNSNVVVDNSTSINGNVTFGTVANPQITRLTASDLMIHANGNASGAGILIVDGDITINGTLNFTGWILVRGKTVINDSNNDGDTNVLGNATILGSLWTGDLTVKVGGSAIIDFCQFCMNLVDNVPGAGTGYLPRAMIVTSWEEVL